MPRRSINGASLYYEVTGEGPETIVFAHGLLFSTELFAPQIRELSKTYRCIAFDFRGQGKSAVTGGGYDMETLAEDAAALIETLGVAPVHFAGLSMGGFVAMRLAARRPELLRSIVLLDTSADAEPEENVGKYRLLGTVSRWIGPWAVAGQVLPIMFGKTFMNDPARKGEREAWRARIVANDRIGMQRAANGVIDRKPIYPELAKITLPALVLVGEEDVATVPAKAERIAAAIPGARLVTIPRAGHSSTIEEPVAVTAAIAAFLERVTAPAASP